MFNHIMIGSNDIARAQRFYDAVLATLGAGAGMRNVSGSGHVRLFGPGAGPHQQVPGALKLQWFTVLKLKDRLPVKLFRAQVRNIQIITFYDAAISSA